MEKVVKRGRRKRQENRGDVGAGESRERISNSNSG
jgi:hypothetical protein